MSVDDLVADLDTRLAATDAALASPEPSAAAGGVDGGRQPVHTVYVPADRVHPGVCPDWGATARRALDAHAPDPATLLDLLGLVDLPPPAARTRRADDLAAQVHARVAATLASRPVEDLRADFEDGYGTRPDDEEDAAARAVAGALATALRDGTAPPRLGVRVKSLEPATRARAVRTLDLVVAALVARGGVPDGFVVTWPKVSAPAQLEAALRLCAALEEQHGVAPGTLRCEAQVETPRAVLGVDGTATAALLVRAGGDRLLGLHLGAYDYGDALGVPPGWEGPDHPVNEAAKAVLQVAAAGTGVDVVDGGVQALPVGDTAAVHAAWRRHARVVRRALARGLAQGWDVHPAQLVTRYAATYAFSREGLPGALDRLSAYATSRGGATLDEPATARALARFVLRALDCGACDGDETGVLDRVTLERLALR